MRHLRILAATFASLLVVTGLYAQAPAGLKKLAIGKVKVGQAVQADAVDAGKKNKIDRMTQNVGTQLRAAFQASRRFEIVGRSDADALVEEAGATGRTFAFGDADYLLVVEIDDFQDSMETKTFAALGKTVTSRTIRFAGITTIYNAKTNAVIETANIDVSETAPEETRGSTTGDTRDALLRELTKKLAELTAQRVTDVVYPARILAKTDKTVTISRGEGTGVAAGQLWEVFALGAEMKDPDTGASLGREELSVGKIRITRVTPKTSQATITEDTGVDNGAVVRPVKN
jgi:hypothetical protein